MEQFIRLAAWAWFRREISQILFEGIDLVWHQLCQENSWKIPDGIQQKSIEKKYAQAKASRKLQMKYLQESGCLRLIKTQESLLWFENPEIMIPVP